MAHREKRVRATKLILSVRYTVKEEHSLFEFRKYVDQGQSRAITEAAVAPVPLGDRMGDIVSTEKDGSITVSLVTGPKVDPQPSFEKS